jgi:two-component system NtrC family response regulator
MQQLVQARWPGNVRQLRNIIERIVVTSIRDKIFIDDLPRELFRDAVSADATLHKNVRTLAEITDAAEKSGIENALAANDHHREFTAKALGISVRTLHYKMNKYDLH